jgi:hypothetical protein
LDDKNDIDNIIKLINCLEGNIKKNKNGDANYEDNKKKERKKVINEFIEKLLKKYKFEKDEFFSGRNNPKILLIYELFTKKKNRKK